MSHFNGIQLFLLAILALFFIYLAGRAWTAGSMRSWLDAMKGTKPQQKEEKHEEQQDKIDEG